MESNRRYKGKVTDETDRSLAVGCRIGKTGEDVYTTTTTVESDIEALVKRRKGHVSTKPTSSYRSEMSLSWILALSVSYRSVKG